MADTTGDLDSFFARKDKKKKGQTWDKKKKSNKNENAESAQIFGPESIEHDEWGEIQDDLSKSVKTVDQSVVEEGGRGSPSSGNQRSSGGDMHTICEEDSGGVERDNKGPWHLTPANTTSSSDPPAPAPTATVDGPSSNHSGGDAAATVGSGVATGANENKKEEEKSKEDESTVESKYVPPWMRNKSGPMTATADSPAGAKYLPPVRARGQSHLQTKPPDVQSQSDFPSLGGANTNPDGQNAWQRSQASSAT